MKHLNFSFLILLSATLSSCELAGSIFKGGVWTGVILVLIVVAIIFYAISRGSKK